MVIPRIFYDHTADSAGFETPSSIFAIHGDLDGEKAHGGDFVEREQFIGLIVGAEEFLLPISAVREIIMLVPITFVPNAPEFIDGVINLRGTILPAVNMRKMMGVPRGDITSAARIIVVRIEDVTCALLVDGITYVIALLPSEIEHQTLPGKGTGAEFLGSIAKNGAKVCGILDLTRVLRALAPAGLEDNEDEASSQAA
jgi:purine-binding chemotaxis protein CheW